MPLRKRVAKVKHPSLRRGPKINRPEKQPSSFLNASFQEKTWAVACKASFFSPTFAAPKRKTVMFFVRQTVW